MDRSGQWLEETFRRLLEAAPDAMVIVDRGGSVLHVNAEAERLFGYARDEIVGASVEQLIPERLRAAHPGHRARYFDAPKTRLMGQGGLELYGLRRDGTEFPAEISLSPMEIGDGMVAITAIRDISGRKDVERALLEAKAAADAANEELTSFSYSVAHDLRAPLRSITGFSEILQQDYAGQLDARGQEYIRRIGAAAQRMGSLIEALLELSRVTRAEVRRERVDLVRIARSVVAHLQEASPGRQVGVTLGDLPPATGDPQLLRSMLENLLSNAWKFTGKRADARVEVGAVIGEDGAPVYFVRDNGAGFDMANAAKIFTPFQRFHAASQFPGSGIGLATVERIVQRHGGRIWAQAAVNDGATFHFTLASRA